MGDAELEEAIRVNLFAPAALARAASQQIKERGEGDIVFISSVAGRVATPANGTVFTATKFGLRGLRLALRQELHGTGVGVSTISPGPIRDAGMFAPRRRHEFHQYVARAVARAIESDHAETTVATGSVRLSAAIGAVAPTPVGTLVHIRFRRCRWCRGGGGVGVALVVNPRAEAPSVTQPSPHTTS